MFEQFYDTSGPNGLFVFLLLTVLIGGGGAWRTGQAVAESWRPFWPVAGYTFLIALAVRFLHYALFAGPLFSPRNLLIDYAVLLALGALGHRVRRARLMTEQYPWLYIRVSPLFWRSRGGW